jgi:hypothetical protein
MKMVAIKKLPVVKFQRKDRIDSLQKGCVYMKTLRYYQEREAKFNDTIVGDAGEARWHINDAIMTVTPVLGGETKMEKLNDVWFDTIHSDDYVFCLFGVNPYKHDAFEYTQEQKEKIAEFGDTALIITDFPELCRRIINAAERDGFAVKGAFVQYYDETVDDANRIISLMLDMRNIAFQKRKQYAYQQEYRFLLTPKNDDKAEHIVLDIGNIEDISMTFKTADVLRSRIESASDANK